MIILHTFDSSSGQGSPFAIKLETFLRMTGVPYETAFVKDDLGSPNGKVPYIVKENGELLGDSQVIMDYLTEKYSLDIDKHLTQEDRIQKIFIRHALEDHLYWGVSYLLFNGSSSQKFRKAMKAMKPFLASPAYFRRRKKQHIIQGIARYSEEDVIKYAKEDIDAIAFQLKGKKYVFGDKISSIDACVYAFLNTLLFTPLDSEVISYARTFPQFGEYCQRIRGEYWPEVESGPYRAIYYPQKTA